MNGDYKFYVDGSPINVFIGNIEKICEMASAMYDGLIKNGFSREEALTIVNNFVIKAAFNVSGK